MLMKVKRLKNYLKILICVVTLCCVVMSLTLHHCPTPQLGLPDRLLKNVKRLKKVAIRPCLYQIFSVTLQQI